MAKSKAAAFAQLLKEAASAQRGGRLLQAELLLTQILEDSPGHAAALNHLGALRCRQGDLEGGLALLDQALQSKPGYVDALNSRGNALRDLRRPEEALASYERALAIEPANGDALYNCGAALQELGRHAEAVERLQRAHALAPRDAETLNDLGVSLRALGREEDALKRFRQALRLRPEFGDALSNSGNALRATGRIREAIAAYRGALALAPDNPEIHFNLALALLAVGEWPEGWREYEWRHGTRQFAGSARDFGRPPWRGEAELEGRTILLHAEQGLGDTLMFARYLPLVARRGARVVLEVPKRVAPLFEGMEGIAQLAIAGEPLPAFDLHCPLPGLPLAFGTTPWSVPPPLAYRAPSGAAAGGPQGPAPRVGIVWSGNPDYARDRVRSVDLALLEPALAAGGAAIISLQKEVSARDVELLARRGIAHTGPGQRDFADAAALISGLDLVLTVDTSVAHLAGSMGKPLWMMLSYAPDWRWGSEGEGSPWYRQARLFRQERRDDWSAPLARIAEALRAWPARPA